MKLELFEKIMQYHVRFLTGDTTGEKAEIFGECLPSIDLSKYDFRGVHFGNVKLDRCWNACNVTFANSTLQAVDFSHVIDLYSTDFSGAHIQDCAFEDCDLSFANFSETGLYGVSFARSCLQHANFTHARIRDTSFHKADLSGVVGMLSVSEFMNRFEECPDGWIVYKVMGNTSYRPSPRWSEEEGSVLTEVANPDRSVPCGCGVNFATEDWCRAHYDIDDYCRLWKCLIEWKDGPDIVAPYNTDGKARCNRLTLLERIA